jgi:hypothetical protein
MAYDKNTPLTEEQRADLEALAEKVRNAYGEFRKALSAVRPTDDPDWSCLACPKEPGGAICSSFMGDTNDLDARCRRPFCGHTLLWHVGG